jgi:hypothetical protein
VAKPSKNTVEHDPQNCNKKVSIDRYSGGRINIYLRPVLVPLASNNVTLGVVCILESVELSPAAGCIVFSVNIFCPSHTELLNHNQRQLSAGQVWKPGKEEIFIQTRHDYSSGSQCKWPHRPAKYFASIIRRNSFFFFISRQTVSAK